MKRRLRPIRSRPNLGGSWPRVEFEAWARQPDEATFARFTQAQKKMLELAPNSADVWMAVGDWEYGAFSIEKRRGKKVAASDAVQSAIGAYGRAVQLYPNSAICHARLAEAHFAAGDRSAFAREAEIALRLDRATPHKDKKLPSELRDRLRDELKKAE